MSSIVDLVNFLGQFPEAVGVVHGVEDGEAQRMFVNGAASGLLGTIRADADLAPHLSRSDRIRLGALCTLIRTEAAQSVGPLTMRLTSFAGVAPVEVWVTATTSIDLHLANRPDAPSWAGGDSVAFADRRNGGETAVSATLIRFDPIGHVYGAVVGHTAPEPLEPIGTATGDNIEEDGVHHAEQTRNPVRQHGHEANLLASLNRTEIEVLRHTITGERVQTISTRLFLSEHTVRNSLKRINRKMGTHSTAELREVLGSTAGGNGIHR